MSRRRDMYPRKVIHRTVTSTVENMAISLRTPPTGLASDIEIWTKPLAQRTLPRVCTSADRERERVEISWVTEIGGLHDPTSTKNAGGTPGSKITALVLVPVLGLVEGSVVRSDSRGFGVAGSSSKCAVASIVW